MGGTRAHRRLLYCESSPKVRPWLQFAQAARGCIYPNFVLGRREIGASASNYRADAISVIALSAAGLATALLQLLRRVLKGAEVGCRRHITLSRLSAHTASASVSVQRPNVCE